MDTHLANTGTTLSGSTGFGTPDPAKLRLRLLVNAAWDIRHNFTTGFVWDLPFGKGRAYGANMNSVVNSIVGNWQVNGILALRTGSPLHSPVEWLPRRLECMPPGCSGR